jgi:malic enzyme
VFHDDQHGTAIISGAGLINAAELAKKQLADIMLVVSGAGAAAIACVEFFCSLGLVRDNVVLVDSKGVIHRGRTDLGRQKQKFAVADDGRRTLADAMRGADMFMGVSVANTVTPDMLKTMADRPIVFALANPDPEVDPEAAMEHAAVVATGRSDYPNQINNVLAFPGVVRGLLDAQSRHVSDEMLIAAAQALADVVSPDEIGPHYIIPSVFHPDVASSVAVAVRDAATQQLDR